MKNEDFQSIRMARNNLRLVKKYHSRVSNDANLNSALQAIEAVMDRNRKGGRNE